MPIRLNARLDRSGIRVLCGRSGCPADLTFIEERVERGHYLLLARTLYLESGWKQGSAGTWVMTNHAWKRVRQGKRPISQRGSQAYPGSCASGRVADLRLAAQVFQGHQKHPDVRVNVVPTTNLIVQEAARERIVTTLAESGVFLSSPSCDYCFGAISPLADGESVSPPAP